MPAPRTVFWVGADLGGSNLRLAVVDDRLAVLDRFRCPTGDRTVKGVLCTLEEGVRRLLRSTGGRVAGVGLGFAGLVDPEEGRVIAAPNFPGWKDVPIGPLLEKRLGIPVHVENDANAIAVGEHRMGAARGVRDVLVLTLGTGVGGGLVLGGRLRRGPDGTAGEVGHMPVFPAGRRCSCGGQGCLEMYASATAVEASCREVRPGLSTASEFSRAARSGDAALRRIFSLAGRAVGIAVAGLVNVLNLEMLVVGGGLAGAWDLMEPAARRELARRAFGLPGRRLRLRPWALGDDAGPVGNVILVRERVGALRTEDTSGRDRSYDA